MKTIILLPTYNEKDNVAAMVEAILEVQPHIHILIIDDNSPDGTGKIAEEIKQKHRGVDVLHRSEKKGLGKAYIHGFNIALERGYEVMITMDCDFSHHPIYVPQMLATIEKHDLVLGSRYVRSGGVKGWGLLRKIISRGGSIYSRFFLGLPWKDLTGGFKCFRAEVLRQIDMETIHAHGYTFQIETTYRAHRLGFRIKEIPIIFEDRRVGQSKMSFAIFWEAVVLVPRLRFRRK